jgi:hypothetical protein
MSNAAENEACAVIVDAEMQRLGAEAETASAEGRHGNALAAWRAAYVCLRLSSAIRARVPRYTGLSHGSPGRWSDDGDGSPGDQPDPEPKPLPPSLDITKLLERALA